MPPTKAPATPFYPNAPALLAKIVEALGSGKTVYISTVYRSTKITPSTWRKWEASGVPLLRATPEYGLRLREGKGYVDANGCRVTVEG